MLEEIDVTKEKKKECSGAFDSLPKFHVQENEPSSTEQVKEQIVKVHRKTLLLGLEDNLEKMQELNDELQHLKSQIKEKRDGYIRKIWDLTFSLTDTVQDMVLEYAGSKTKREMDKIMKNRYEDATKNLSKKVSEQLPEDAKTYFNEDTIGKAIKIYAKLDHKVLKEMTQEVKICFPADAVVVEEMKGEMKICDGRVGDRLLTASTDGTLLYEDVFMLGKYLNNFTYYQQIQYPDEVLFLYPIFFSSNMAIATVWSNIFVHVQELNRRFYFQNSHFS